VTQVLEHLPSKCKTLSSNPNTSKTERNREETKSKHGGNMPEF
jgi:hypothetical protein